MESPARSGLTDQELIKVGKKAYDMAHGSDEFEHDHFDILLRDYTKYLISMRSCSEEWPDFYEWRRLDDKV